MSLYNLVHQTNPLAPVVLIILGVKPQTTARLRDAWYDGQHLVVLTRTGGGNREAYAESNNHLAAHPNYVSDADVEYDPTYAEFKFNIPEGFEYMRAKFEPFKKTQTFAEQWEAALADLRSDTPSERSKNLVEAFNGLFTELEKHMRN